MAVVLGAAAAAGAGSGAETPKEALLVLSKGAHTLSIVDPATLKVVGKAPVGEDPHEVVASSDGRRAYVSNYGFGRFHTLAVIDLVGQKALKPIDLGPLSGPHGLVFEGGKTWFTAEGAKVIGRYDPATGKVDWVMGTGQDRTHMLYVFPGEEKIVTTNVASGTVTVLEKKAAQGPGGPGPMPGGNWEETVIGVGHGGEGFDVSPDGKQMWVANAGDGTVSVIDLESKTLAKTLEANEKGANRLKFTPDGSKVFISSLSGAGVVVLDAGSGRELKRLPARGAEGMQMEPGGKRVFVSYTAEDYVAVIDLSTLEVVGKIDAGKEPDGLAWAVRP
jgi:YVTN family beta-propeller protein